MTGLRRSRAASGGEVSTTTPRPLRVLVVAPSLDRVGGQAVQAVRLVEALVGEPSLTPSFLRSDPQLPSRLQWLQTLRYIRTLVNLVAYLGTLFARVPQSDVIHVFAASFWSFALTTTPAVFAGKLLRKRVIVNYHSGQAAEHLARWRSAVWTLRRVDGIVVQSAYLQTVFGRFGLPATVVPNHLDLDRFSFRDRRPLRPSFLTCRALEPEYDVATVLKACALVQHDFPELSLVVAGDGSQRLSLERLAERLRLRDTTFVGAVEPIEMARIYDEADVMLNGSRVDSMPVSMLEAFASGLPIVTTDAGGIPFLVAHEQTGLVVRIGDARAMAEAAARLLTDDRLAARLVSAARAESVAYTWASTRAKWLTLYLGAGAAWAS